MTIDEFSEFINTSAAITDKITIDYMFKTIDRDNKGYISSDDLKRVLNNEDEVLKSQVIIMPIDILLPLSHTVRNTLGMTAFQIYEKFRTGTAGI